MVSQELSGGGRGFGARFVDVNDGDGDLMARETLRGEVIENDATDDAGQQHNGIAGGEGGGGSDGGGGEISGDGVGGGSGGVRPGHEGRAQSAYGSHYLMRWGRGRGVSDELTNVWLVNNLDLKTCS